jgi:hypothetical protein
MAVLSRGISAGALIAAALFALGCGSEPSGPLDPALTGSWILPSVDTYEMFALEQRGDRVSGTVGFYSPVQSAPLTYPVSGSAALPHVILRWVEGSNLQTFDATLSEDEQSLTGTFTPGGGTYTFHRQAPPG